MKISRLISLAFICFIPGTIVAQSTKTLRSHNDESPWTIDLQVGYPVPISPSMRGSLSQFEFEVGKDYNNSVFPFHSPSGSYGASAFGIEYRFFPGNLSAYISYSVTNFTFVVTGSDSVTLAFNSVGLGAKYSYDVSRSFDLFARAGINGSHISGDFEYMLQSVSLTTSNLRFGLELGAGMDWNPWSILLFQLFADFSDINIIGKSYTAPVASPPNYISSRGLNDGANPADPNDKSRTIDYLFVGLSIGVRF